jgi:hypothetical protein
MVVFWFSIEIVIQTFSILINYKVSTFYKAKIINLTNIFIFIFVFTGVLGF